MDNTTNSISFNVTEQTPSLRFIASLSDGRTVIQDDRPNEKHAWLRLQDYLRSIEGINITCLRLQCGEQEHVMPSGQKGYYLGKQTRAVFPGGGSCNYTGIGYYDGDKVVVLWAKDHDISQTFAEEIDVQKASFFLYVNRI